MLQILYTRISTATQKDDRQKYDADLIFSDVCSGATSFKERREAQKLIEYISTSKDDCTIYVHSIDRLGRNLSDILGTIDLFASLGCNLISNKEGLTLLDNDGNINAVAKMTIGILGSVAEFEKERINERTREGIAIAKAKGKYKNNGMNRKGKVQSKEKTLKKYAHVVTLLNSGMTIRAVADATKTSPTTIQKVRKLL